MASILTVPGEIAPESEVELRILYSSLWPGGSWKLSNAAWKFSFGHAGEGRVRKRHEAGEDSKLKVTDSVSSRRNIGQLPENSGQPSPKTGWLPATLRALRHRNFQIFFSGQLVSLIGTWMQSVAQSWLVYRLTGSSLLLGAAGFASQIPVFLVAPLGGIAADRFNRQRVVIGTQISSMVLAFILAVLTLTRTVQVWHIFVLAALLGVVNAFDIPARQSFLVEMVGKEDLMNAIALNSSMFNGARIIGPAIAGILVAKIGEGWCFFANAVSYIAVIVGLLMMRVARPARRRRPAQRWRTSSKASFSPATPRPFGHCYFCSDWSVWWRCPIPCSCRCSRTRFCTEGRAAWEF